MRVPAMACVGAVGLLFVTVWFSVALTYVSLGLAWAAGAGWWLAAPGRRTEARRLAAGLLAPVAAFFVASLLATLAGVAPDRGFDRLRAEVIGLGALVAGAAVSRETDARRLLAVLLGMAAVSGLFAIYQVVLVFQGQLDIGHRAHGFWHPGAYVSYGNVLAMMAALALGWWVLGTPQVRCYAAACGAGALVGLVLSYTRAGWVGLGLVSAGVAVWRGSVATLVAGVLLVTSLTVTPLGRGIVHRAVSAFDTRAEVNVDRLARYRVGVAVLRDYPWLGTGPGGLSVVYPRYAAPEARENWHLHNTYLQILVERGAAALVAWVALFGIGVSRTLRSLARTRRDARADALGIGLALLVMGILGLFNYIWEDWRIRSIVLALLGLAWSPALTGTPDARPAGPASEVATR